MYKLVSTCLVIIAAGALSSAAVADGGYGNRDSALTPFQKLIEAQRYQAAIDKLQSALAEKPNDADLLNLLAFSQRKLERFDEALVNYRKALEIEPEHRGANEYLGELYLQLGQPEMAEERLKVLDGACFFGCDEYDELENAIEAYRAEKQT